MKKCCPRNTRSTPMKHNLRDKAFVAFVCLVGKPLLPKIVVGNHRPKKSSQSAMNLAYSGARSLGGEAASVSQRVQESPRRPFHLCAEWVNGVDRLLPWRAVASAEAAKTMAGESPEARDISHNGRLICQRSTARVRASLFNILNKIF
jgi:hypothetical protein